MESDSSDTSQLSDAQLADLFGGSDTGSGNSGSSGSSNFLGTLADLAKTGAGVYNQVNGGNRNPLAVNQQARVAATPVNWKKYLPWIGGAVVLLVIVGLIFRRE